MGEQTAKTRGSKVTTVRFTVNDLIAFWIEVQIQLFQARKTYRRNISEITDFMRSSRVTAPVSATHISDAAQQTTSEILQLPAHISAQCKPAAAALEGRSMAQICEAFLRAGSESYKKEGAKFLNRFFGRHQQGQSQ